MIRRVGAIALSVVTDALRRKIVYVVVLFAAVMAASIPLLPSYGVGVEGAVFREVALTLTYLAAVVVILALSASRIPGEIERRTVYNVLARSVRRWEYLLGTWFGIAITSAAVLAAFGTVIFGLGWALYGQPMWQLWQGVLAIWMESCVVAAVCISVSTLAGPVVVATATIAFLFIAHARAGLLAPDQLAWQLYPSLDAFNIINPVAHGNGVEFAYLLTMTAVFVAWVGASLLIGAAAFERRDL